MIFPYSKDAACENEIGRLTAALARPGGNVTGISLLSPELDGKRQGLLIEAVPSVRWRRWSIPASHHNIASKPCETLHNPAV
jgi:hypothetical protein